MKAEGLLRLGLAAYFIIGGTILTTKLDAFYFGALCTLSAIAVLTVKVNQKCK